MEPPIVYAYSYVRISSQQQRKGDGPRRQLEATRRWCQEQGLHLDESFRLEDLGRSAFKGEHRGPKAALPAFLAAVEEGRVPSGSTLVVENLDRLSREDIDEALEMFLRLLRSGIRIKTHDPDRLYTRADLRGNPYAIIEPLVIFARANDESRVKSYRGKDRWETRRREARGGRKVTRTIPAWLEVDAERTRFTVKKEAAAVVHRIFALACDGLGCPGIARVLNSEGVAPIGSAMHWNHAYVHVLLTGRAVRGEYQPCRKVEGRRVPAGDPILDYYPSIIEEPIWQRAQAALHHRKRARGRPSKTINLFTGLVYDGHDGSVMHMHARYGVATLVSSAALRGTPGSVWRGFRYDHFEAAFLRFVSDIKPEDLLPFRVAPDEAAEIAGELQVVAHKITVVQDRIAKEPEIESLIEVLARLEGERRVLKERLEEAKRRRVMGAEEVLGEVHSVASLLPEADPAEVPVLRTRFAARVRSLVTAIHLRVWDGLVGVRVAMAEVVFHDQSRRWFTCGYGTTRRKVDDLYKCGTGRHPREEWIATLADDSPM